MVIVGGMTLLAVLVAWIGLALSSRFRRPGLFKIGALSVSAGLMLLWMSVWWVSTRDFGAWAMPAFIAALFVPISMVGAGLGAMRLASTGQSETEFDRILQTSDPYDETDLL